MARPSAPSLEVAPDAAQALLGSSASSYSKTPASDSAELRIQKGLMAMGANFGLARLVAETDTQIALRIFILDNSGSTSSYDGKYLDAEARGGKMAMVQCSRWEEIRRMAVQQATMNMYTGTPCEFVLLNPPSSRKFGAFREGVDLATVDKRRGDVAPQLDALEKLLRNTRPQGATPLAERLREIQHRLQTVHSGLAESGRRSVVVVATDGLPTMPGTGVPCGAARDEVTAVIRQLTMSLPVFLVVRLTTDEDSVVKYYNSIDAEEELPLEVIDDIEGEAREASAAGNGWLVYSPLLHMIREGGTFVRFLDALDERRLKPPEVQLLASCLLQHGENDLPMPRDAVDFYAGVRAGASSMPAVYDPLTRRVVPGLKLRQLRRALGLSPLAMACAWCQGR